MTDVRIPSGIERIADWAFHGCSGLTSLSIPENVRSIGALAFSECTGLSTFTIPENVASIGNAAFRGCASLRNVYAKGDAPEADSTIFLNTGTLTVHYLPGTEGWQAEFGGRPTVLWLPRVRIEGRGTKPFGFTIDWTSGRVVVIEVSTELNSRTWATLQSITLASDSFEFFDPLSEEFPGRYFRVRIP